MKKTRLNLMQQEMLMHAMRQMLPYGLLQDMDGTVVFYNREYEVMSFGGQQEFHFDPMEMGDIFRDVLPGKFLITEAGQQYVGTMYYLYLDDDAPIYLHNQQYVTSYLMRWTQVMKPVISQVGNAYNRRSATRKQLNAVNRKLDLMYSMEVKSEK